MLLVVSPLLLNICSLCLIFVNLINMCLGVFRLGLILFGTLWVYWTWMAISFPLLGKFSTIISSIFSWLFFFFFWSSYGTLIIQMLGCITLSQRFLRFCSFLLILFSFFPLFFIYFRLSIFHLTYPIFCLSYPTIGSLQSAFDLSYCIIITD